MITLQHVEFFTAGISFASPPPPGEDGHSGQAKSRLLILGLEAC